MSSRVSRARRSSVGSTPAATRSRRTRPLTPEEDEAAVTPDTNRSSLPVDSTPLPAPTFIEDYEESTPDNFSSRSRSRSSVRFSSSSPVSSSSDPFSPTVSLSARFDSAISNDLISLTQPPTYISPLVSRSSLSPLYPLLTPHIHMNGFIRRGVPTFRRISDCLLTLKWKSFNYQSINAYLMIIGILLSFLLGMNGWFIQAVATNSRLNFSAFLVSLTLYSLSLLVFLSYFLLLPLPFFYHRVSSYTFIAQFLLFCSILCFFFFHPQEFPLPSIIPEREKWINEQSGLTWVVFYGLGAFFLYLATFLASYRLGSYTESSLVMKFAALSLPLSIIIPWYINSTGFTCRPQTIASLLVLGAFLHLFRLPERLVRRKFDLCGNSSHLLSLCGIISGYLLFSHFLRFATDRGDLLWENDVIRVFHSSVNSIKDYLN
jgi:hypothetical protein